MAAFVSVTADGGTLVPTPLARLTALTDEGDAQVHAVEAALLGPGADAVGPRLTAAARASEEAHRASARAEAALAAAAGAQRETRWRTKRYCPKPKEGHYAPMGFTFSLDGATGVAHAYDRLVGDGLGSRAGAAQCQALCPTPYFTYDKYTDQCNCSTNGKRTFDGGMRDTNGAARLFWGGIFGFGGGKGRYAAQTCTGASVERGLGFRGCPLDNVVASHPGTSDAHGTTVPIRGTRTRDECKGKALDLGVPVVEYHARDNVCRGRKRDADVNASNARFLLPTRADAATPPAAAGWETMWLCER